MIPKKIKAQLLAAVIIAIFGVIYIIESKKSPRTAPRQAEIPASNTTASSEQKAKQYERAHEIVSPNGFINTDPFKIADFVGKKVILVDFWTYSCINCQRTLPYLTAWWDKYSDKGLLIVGMHTPEFEFEKIKENVEHATAQFGVKYPVVLDNDRATWDAYQNLYWPHKYLIDIDGFIVYDHVGEGGYADTEKKIQELLEERMVRLGMQEVITKDIAAPTGAEIPSSDTASPEIYFGAARNEYLGNGKSGTAGLQNFSQPQEVKINTLYLTGDWNLDPEFAENKIASAKIIFRYQARKVFFVAGAADATVIRVFKDGKPVNAEAGMDVSRDGQGKVMIRETRLYRLIEDTNVGQHTLEIIIERPELKAFTFTFG